ncbi:hypothetical protein FOB58_001489 [Candida parapsilosis]|uniref:25S rRNA (Uridine(2843)-N(3))-methyltransferase n=2 Tax=Candida parapsilosis TaxID=5480 RepID=G8BBL3_CANPC|nr:uncharacterized protein CPAR2_800800 [Candida parapsilosis]KAF6051429.1 hypothetical protein FOB58_001489 [Candida parapsilosis]KAF6053074.1 hypothetical protein FOB60_003330 [Candida parapsilosis]KAF6053231.1 hypothetical protein FOB59_001513 [Candida parapsilosis]KAF6064852.1 hypothetical protein FOB61_003278 [Candida parapsilosis]CAD1810445.1 unnamed protein product [Candida parapsilosis]
MRFYENAAQNWVRDNFSSILTKNANYITMVGGKSKSNELDRDSPSTLPFTNENSLEPYQILDAFTVCFKHILDSHELDSFIQKVKGDLYNRDYIAAFNDDNKRFGYAARWSPSRALAYASLFSNLEPITELLQESEKVKRVLCVGGGAASEIVGLGAVYCRLKEFHPNSPSRLDIDVVDIADWTVVVNQLTNYVKQNWVYKEHNFNTQFKHEDILSTKIDDLASFDLITLLFTTNELFAEKRKETIKLLQTLSTGCKSGTLLLIAESAGSFSHITIGNKQFPVQFLIDTILVGKQGEGNGSWEIISEKESIWYRINEREVTYPLKLENMRFFYRLYRRK